MSERPFAKRTEPTAAPIEINAPAGQRILKGTTAAIHLSPKTTLTNSGAMIKSKVKAGNEIMEI